MISCLVCSTLHVLASTWQKKPADGGQKEQRKEAAGGDVQRSDSLNSEATIPPTEEELAKQMTAVKNANEIRLSESQQAQQQYQKNRSAPLTEDQQALLRKVGETPILARTTGSAQQTGSTKATKDAKPAKHQTNKGSKKKGRGKGKCITKGKNASKKTKAVKKAQLKGKPAKIQKQVPAPPAPPAQVPAPPVEVAQVATPPAPPAQVPAPSVEVAQVAAPPAQVPTPAQVAQVPAPQEVQQPAPSGQCQVPVKHEPQEDLRTVATPARSGGPSSAPPPLPGQVVVDMLNRTQTQDQLALQTPQQKKPVETPKRKKMGDTDPDPPEPSPPDTTEQPTKKKRDLARHARKMRFYRSLDSHDLK